MRKSRWIIGIALAVGTIVTVAREQHSAREKYEAQRQKDCVALAITPEEKHTCDKDAQGRKDYTEWWDILVEWPNGIGAWALIATLMGILWQADETRKSAIATAESVNVAYGNLSFMEAQFELLKEKDRAKLDVSVERNDLEADVQGEHLLHLISTLSIRNVGESKAFISVIRGVLVNRVGNEPLGEIGQATLDLPDRVLEPNKTPLVTKAYCFPEATAPTFAECLEQGTYSLHFFGFIEYETMGLWWRKEFGYDWKIIDRSSSLGGMLGLPDPYPNSPRPAKDRITYGHWSPSDEKEKPEYPISKPQGENEAN